MTSRHNTRGKNKRVKIEDTEIPPARFSVRKNNDGATDEERGRLEVAGEYHLGEFVNRFRHGSLVMRLPDSEAGNIPTVIFGTVNGVIGVVASLPHEQFLFMEKLQSNLVKVIKGVAMTFHMH